MVYSGYNQCIKKVDLKDLKEDYFLNDLIFRISKANIKIHQINSEFIVTKYVV